jgi:hypothetical protein
MTSDGELGLQDRTVPRLPQLLRQDRWSDHRARGLHNRAGAVEQLDEALLRILHSHSGRVGPLAVGVECSCVQSMQIVVDLIIQVGAEPECHEQRSAESTSSIAAANAT